MKQALTLSLTLLLAGAMSLAQQAPSAGQSSDQNLGQTNSGNQNTLQGCLHGSDGNWTLVDQSSGTTYRLVGDTSQFKDHSGHLVAVTGNSSTSGAASSSSAANQPSNTENPNNSNQSQATFNVTSVRHVSKSCSAAGSGASNLPQSSASPEQTAQSSTSSSASSSTMPQGSTSANPSTTQPQSGDINSAQASQQSSTSANQSSSASASQSAGAASNLPQSGEPSAAGAANAGNGVRGCLQDGKGSFTLKADDGRIFQLTGDTSKLAEHVNHEIEITGDAASSETASNSNGQSTLNIRDVKMISTSCKEGSTSPLPQSDMGSSAAAPATTQTAPMATAPGEAPVTSQTPAQTTGSEKTTAPDAAAGTATGESVPSATQSQQSTSKPHKKHNDTTPHFMPTAK